MRAVLHETFPSSGASAPTIPFRSVDFPAPFGPTIAVRLPEGMVASR